jgi:hypothetical protein
METGHRITAVQCYVRRTPTSRTLDPDIHFFQELLSASVRKEDLHENGWMHVGIPPYALWPLCLQRQASGFHLSNWEQT